MNKGMLVSELRSRYPKALGIRKRLAKGRVMLIQKHIIPAEEAKWAEENKQQAEIVKKYRKKWKQYFNPMEKKIEMLLQQASCYKERKDKEFLQTDMLFCWIAYGFQPDEYLCFELEGKSFAERKEYISDTDRYSYVYSICDISDMQMFLNKIKTYQMFHDFYKRDAVQIRKKSDYGRFEAFVNKHKEFVKKKACASRGSGVELVRFEELGMSVKEYFEKLLRSGRYLLEERIEQGIETACLNRSSVNTVRCVTFYSRQEIMIPYCFIKVGKNGSFIDNGGAGGILVGIDNGTGVLNTDGYDELNRKYEVHPNSKVQFKGFQLPEWEKMKSICVKLAQRMPSVKYIGWDMAYSTKGWVVVEGNMGQFIGQQIVWKKGIKKEVDHIMESIDKAI